MDSYSYFSNKPTSIKHITLFGFPLNKAPGVPSSRDASRLKHTRKRTHILFLCCDTWLLCSWMLLYWALLATRMLCWQLQAGQNWLDHHHCVCWGMELDSTLKESDDTDLPCCWWSEGQVERNHLFLSCRTVALRSRSLQLVLWAPLLLQVQDQSFLNWPPDLMHRARGIWHMKIRALFLRSENLGSSPLMLWRLWLWVLSPFLLRPVSFLLSKLPRTEFLI